MLSRHFDQNLHRSKITRLFKMSNFCCALHETAGIQASRNRKVSEELNVSIDFLQAQKTFVPLWNDHFNGLHSVPLLRREHARMSRIGREHARMSCIGKNHSC